MPKTDDFLFWRGFCSKSWEGYKSLSGGPAATRQVERFQAFHVCLNSWADFKKFSAFGAHNPIVLANFQMFSWGFRTSRQTRFGHLGGRIRPERKLVTPQGLERKN